MSKALNPPGRLGPAMDDPYLEDLSAGPRCPQCGFRGWYEGEEGDLYCQEPGCPHAARVRAQDAEDSAKQRADKAAREAAEAKRQQAFDDYEERLRRGNACR
jgi:hypothetical protein